MLYLLFEKQSDARWKFTESAYEKLTLRNPLEQKLVQVDTLSNSKLDGLYRFFLVCKNDDDSIEMIHFRKNSITLDQAITNLVENNGSDLINEYEEVFYSYLMKAYREETQGRTDLRFTDLLTWFQDHHGGYIWSQTIRF